MACQLPSQQVYSAPKLTQKRFLIAALHMNSLAKQDNIRELKESLQSLPEDLDKTYDNALERIRQQEPRKLARADQVLRLVSCARRPLKLDEMQQMLSIRIGDTYIDPEAIPKSESVISTCCGLVVVEDDSQIVRLVHYTCGEYFQRNLQSYRSPEAHGYIAGVLITYLGFTTFTYFSLMKVLQDATDEAAARDPNSTLSWSEERTVVANYIEGFLEGYALLQYAAVNWGHHVREAFTDIRPHPDASTTSHHSDTNEVDSVWTLVRLTQDLLGKENNMDCANEVFHHVEKQFDSIGLATEFVAPMYLTSLHVTASFGILYLVKYYLDQGVDIDAKYSEGMTALHKAAKYGHENVVRLLLTSGAAIGIRDQWEQNALVWAVGANQVSVSRVLLQNAIDPGFQPSRKAPMCIAASRGYEEIVELLAESQTDIMMKKDLLRRTLLDAALCGRDGIVRLLARGGRNWNVSKQCLARAMTQAAAHGHVTTMEILLNAGVDVKSPLSYGKDSLREAATYGHLEATRLLLTAGADPNLKPEGDDFPLHAAARNGHVATVALLLNKGADVDALSSKGETALVVIAGPKYGFLARAESLPENAVLVMRQLLEKGANVNAVEPRSNRTPLEHAIVRGHEALVQLLLQYGAFDASRKDTMLYLTRLYHAIRSSNAEGTIDRLLCEKEAQDLKNISKLLLMSIPAERGYERAVVAFLESGAAIEAEDHLMGHTALQVSAMSGNIAIVRRLLQEGANINSRGSTDSTPLMMAAQRGRTDVVELLLNEGAAIDNTPVNEDASRTALALALDGKHTATARILLERGAHANAISSQPAGKRLIHTVASNSSWGQIPNLALLLEKGADLEAKNSDGHTPLVLGIQADNAETVKYLLLEHGADLESRDMMGQTPLMAAVHRHDVDILSLLLDRGALLEARDHHGQTALMVAARKSVPSTLELLLDRGADLEARDGNDHTALVVAVSSGVVSNVEYLLERGASPVAMSAGVGVKDEGVNKWDFERGVKLVLDKRGVGDAVIGG